MKKATTVLDTGYREPPIIEDTSSPEDQTSNIKLPSAKMTSAGSDAGTNTPSVSNQQTVMPMAFMPPRFRGDELDVMNVRDWLKLVEITSGPQLAYYPVEHQDFLRVQYASNLLDGCARDYANDIDMTAKTSWPVWKETMTTRFERNEEDRKAQAAANLQNLQQGSLSLREYLERARKIRDTLGESWDLVIAQKVIAGLNNRQRAEAITITLGKDGLNGVTFKAVASILRVLEPPKDSEMQRDDLKSLESIGLNQEKVSWLRGIQKLNEEATKSQMEHLAKSLAESFSKLSLGGPRNNPGSTPRLPIYGNRTLPANVTCFRCGRPGHTRDVCTNPPLPDQQQREIASKIMAEVAERRAKREAFNTQPSISYAAPAAAIESYYQLSTPNKQADVHSAWDEYFDGNGSDSPASGHQLNYLSTTKTQDSDMDQIDARNMSQFGYFDGPGTYSVNCTQHQGGCFVVGDEDPLEYFTAEAYAAQKRNQATAGVDQNTPGPAKRTRATVSEEDPQPRPKRQPGQPMRMRMMKDHEPFDVVSALRATEVRDPRTGKGIDWGSFLDAAAKEGTKLARAMVRERVQQNPSVTSQTDGNSSRPRQTVNLVDIPQQYSDTQRSANFFTQGWVPHPKGGSTKISQILIDGGSSINMTTEHVVAGLRLKKIPDQRIMIKTANGEESRCEYHVRVPLTVAGVQKVVQAYVLPVKHHRQPAYSFILGRPWLKSVAAVGDYSKDEYKILDENGTYVKLEAAVPSGYLPVPIAKLAQVPAASNQKLDSPQNDIVQAPDVDEEENYWIQENNRVLSEILGDEDTLKAMSQ